MVFGHLTFRLLRLNVRPRRYKSTFKTFRPHSGLYKWNRHLNITHIMESKHVIPEGPSQHVDVQVIGTGAKGTPRAVALNLGHTK